MAKCTGIRCPMQDGYKVDECNHKDCPYRTEPITNADRIRSTSDEELAKWIDWLFGRCEWCDTDKMGTDNCNDVSCTPCILEWLKQPAG